ncbi:MAG: hypothetical protein ABW215_11140 [Kibdelosporangium sp.]
MDTDFLAGVLRTGTVLGTDADLPPDVVSRVLGPPPYSEESRADYGTVEFYWGSHFSLPVHRYETPLPFADFVAGLGIRFEEVSRPELDQRNYWFPDTEMTVVADAGMVRWIGSAFGQEASIMHRYWDRRRQVWQEMKGVLGLSHQARLRWIERNRPGDDEVAGWWFFHCRLIGARATVHEPFPKQPLWIPFALWAWEQGRELGFLTPAKAAVHIAEFVEPGPDSDELARECLSHVTGSMSRADKNLITAAARHRPALTDPSELDHWLRIRADIPIPSVSVPES